MRVAIGYRHGDVFVAIATRPRSRRPLARPHRWSPMCSSGGRRRARSASRAATGTPRLDRAGAHPGATRRSRRDRARLGRRLGRAPFGASERWSGANSSTNFGAAPGPSRHLARRGFDEATHVGQLASATPGRRLRRDALDARRGVRERGPSRAESRRRERRLGVPPRGRARGHAAHQRHRRSASPGAATVHVVSAASHLARRVRRHGARPARRHDAARARLRAREPHGHAASTSRRTRTRAPARSSRSSTSRRPRPSRRPPSATPATLARILPCHDAGRRVREAVHRRRSRTAPSAGSSTPTSRRSLAALLRREGAVRLRRGDPGGHHRGARVAAVPLRARVRAGRPRPATPWRSRRTRSRDGSPSSCGGRSPTPR